MTDKQIMQGLKWCYQVEGSCGDCPYRPDDIKKAKCHDRLGNDVIGLIERQQKEIEEKFETIGQQGRYIKGLKEENEKIKTIIYKMVIDKALAGNARDEAIKEFAERIVSYIDVGHLCSPTMLRWSDLDVKNMIERLAKEMVGEDCDR